jgi:hypothetical protein
MRSVGISETVKVKLLPNYDKSTKPIEVLYKEYMFTKYTRKLRFEPRWRHFKYYSTLHGANDALLVFKKYGKRDYPGADYEKDYPHITPTITITRYKIIKREFL